MPKISIIVPIYNVEKYLARCLDSLINQTFSDIEIICINDGSPDNSLQIATEYAKKDKRIMLKTQSNQGLSGARNTGIEMASSPYIMFCDSDDYYEPNMCELMFRAIDENNVDMAMCGTGVQYLSPKSEIFKGGDKDFFKIEHEGIVNFNNIEEINCAVWNKIFRKSIIDKYNLRFPFGLWYEDAAFFFMFVAVANDFYGLDKPLYNYIRRDDSIMGESVNKTNLKVLDHIKLNMYIYDFYVANNVFAKMQEFFWWNIIRYFKYSINLLPDDKKHLANEEFIKLINKIDKKFLAEADANIKNQISYIVHYGDPNLVEMVKETTLCGKIPLTIVKSSVVKKIYLNKFQIFKRSKTNKRIRYYLFKTKILSLKLKHK